MKAIPARWMARTTPHQAQICFLETIFTELECTASRCIYLLYFKPSGERVLLNQLTVTRTHLELVFAGSWFLSKSVMWKCL